MTQNAHKIRIDFRTAVSNAFFGLFSEPLDNGVMLAASSQCLADSRSTTVRDRTGSIVQGNR